MNIPKEQWSQINDKKVPQGRARLAFVKSYFSCCIYYLKRIENLSISANQSYEKSVELYHSSSIRNTSSSTFRIENVIEGTASDGVNSLRDSLSMSYEISNIAEYCSENSKRTTETIRFEPVELSRNVVIWDLIKLICLYRNYKDRVELIGYSDYFVESRKKTYIQE